MPKKRMVPESETVKASLGVQLLDFAESEALANHSWAGAEEILETVDLSRHPASAQVLRLLLDRGWEADSVTGLLLGIWMRKTGSASEIAADLLALDRTQRRVLTALYAADDGQTVIQFSVTPDGTLLQHSYSRKALAAAEIPVFAT